MGKLLIDERPLTVLPSLVKCVGMERAVILQQIHWLLELPNSGLEHDGQHWVWGNYPQWCADYFTFWEPDTLRKHIVQLEKDGYLFSVQARGFDRTKAYRINTKKIDEIESANRHDHATSKRKKSQAPNRHDHATSMRDDHATSKRQDDATSNRDDHAASYIQKTSTKDFQKSTTDDEDKGASKHDPIPAAWFEVFGGEMPEKISKAIGRELDGCSDAAIIHAIHASAEAGTRTFSYLKKCALNYLPPAPANGNGYHVELPDAKPLPPRPALPANLAPMPTDDPWAVCLAELKSLPGVAESYLTGSRLEEAGMVDNVPLFRVVVEERAASGVGWLTKQAGVAIRRTLSSVLGKPVLIEIVATSQSGPQGQPQPTQQEETPTHA